MEQPAIPKQLLKKADRVLFITHLAIGDFVYLQTCFAAFKKQFPHIKIDLWIDEVRRTRCFWEWKHLKRYSLLDWVEESGFFSTIYSGSYSWRRFNEDLAVVQKQDYPLVVSLCMIRQSQYASYARKMAPRGFVVGLTHEKERSKGAMKYVDASLAIDTLSIDGEHVAYSMQRWFERLFGTPFFDDDKRPFVSIPQQWLSYARLRFVKWGIPQKERRFEKVVFVNAFAKNAARCWPIDRLLRLIISLQEAEQFTGAYFIVNVDPHFYEAVRAFLSNYSLRRVFLFSAQENFFQLPAVISLCDLVISVETSVIHLASALQVPVVALMRKKNPEWRPFYKDRAEIVWAPTRRCWIEDISLDAVLKGVASFTGSLASD